MLLQHVRRQSTSSRVLIAGGGPVGLTLGILLQHVYNVPVDIVERQMQPTQHPQAHFMNVRTMEILRTHMPVLHDRILDATAPPQQVHQSSCVSLHVVMALDLMDGMRFRVSGATTSTAPA
ncbi:hypothetical protein B5M09_006289 [Aphanomyces astaci]|uniref:FAD-binding domain-containing protein n=1 Tax=Aphanomyces astaci TaxID=112090 RepID=A0A3R8DCS2_APHAT|nr:hypothetical protein B5M09_006289 [Aphanomyces astaci]